MFVILLCLISISCFADIPTNENSTGSIEGTVIDHTTHQPLVGANILVLNTNLGAASDINGYFFIDKIHVGQYQLQAIMIGFQTEIKTEILVKTNRVNRVDFKLKTTVLESEETINVTGNYFDKDTERPTSKKTLTSREIKSSPGSGEDIFRILQSMPGVSISGGRSANLIVRGGAPDENRTLLDNIEIASPLHFSRQDASMGIISIITPSIIDNVDFTTGGFPAEYGDKMSSVFEIQMKEGNKTNYNHDIDVNMGGFQAYLDGPILRNGSMIFSIRRGIFDLLTKLMNRAVSPWYWDMVTKASFQPDENHKISVVGFYFNDDAERKETMQAHGELARKYEYSKWDAYGSAIGLNWHYLFGPKGYMLTTAEITGNGWTFLTGRLNNQDMNGSEVQQNTFQLKSQLTYKFFDWTEVKGGFFHKTIDSNQDIWREADTTRIGFVIPAFSKSYNPTLTYKVGGFIQTTFRPVTNISINAGLRYDYYDFTKESKISPRLGIAFNLTNKTTLNAAYGQYYQTPSAYQVALDPANTSLKSGRATHYIVGVEHLLNPDTKISIEAYYKDLNNTFVENDTTDVITNNGSGYAQGIEFGIQKKMSQYFFGSLSYTWSISKRKDAEFLPEYNFDYDRRHNITMVAGYKLSDKWKIGAKFQYASGNPYTPVVASVQKMGEWFVVDGEKNSALFPDYHKLDIRVDRQFQFSNWSMNVYLDMWNVYDNDNVLTYYYEIENNGEYTQKAHDDFPLMPILGISAQF
jgi:outer membrane receptor for ferrienterochelin and colicin